ncbi:hypothetical protein CBS147310_7448 [Penicillium roqueforti]|nr:hypothetical protein CBS147310_7448 [Penicillium roqueforti]
MDRIVEALLPTRELCFLPTTSVFALHKAQLNSLSAFTLAAAVRVDGWISCTGSGLVNGRTGGSYLSRHMVLTPGCGRRLHTTAGQLGRPAVTGAILRK